MFIVALGAGFMAGLAATSPDMYQTADDYMDEYALYDVNVKSTIGFDVSATDKFAALDCVDELQSAKVLDMVMRSGQSSYTSRIMSILSADYDGDDPKQATKLNKFVLTEGRLPHADDECVIQSPSARYLGGALNIGDVIELSDENSNYATLASQMKYTSLKVVGVVQSPRCVSITHEPTTVGTGTIVLDVYTRDNLFTFDYLTDFYVTLKGAKAMDTFSDEYDNLVADCVEKLTVVADECVASRKESLLADAQKSVDTLTTAVEAYFDALVAGKTLNEDAVDRAEQLKQAADGLGNGALSDILGKTAAAIKQGANGDNQAALNALGYYRQAVEEARAQLQTVSSARSLSLTRDDLLSFSTYASNVGKVAALSKVFPVFFFSVALLVALTTMTRLIEENRGQIGTLKALGYGNWQILGEYMMYGLLASVVGCVLGLVVGFKLFPAAIASAYSMMFTVPTCVTPFRWDIVAWVAPITVGSILLATLWACWGEFVSRPTELMRPKAPQAGKRIWLEHISFVWKRLSFTHKVTCRNLFRYKKRLVMTIIGVAGCSALLLTGFGLRDSVNDIVDKQFGEVFKFKLMVTANDESWTADEQLLQRLAQSDVSDYLPVCQISVTAKNGNKKDTFSLCVPHPDNVSDFDKFVSLRTRKGGKEVPFPHDDGVVLTEKLCETLGLRVGDQVTLDYDGVTTTTTLVGITENYVQSYGYMSARTYENIFGDLPKYTTIFVNSDTTDENQLIADIMDSKSVLYVNSVATLRDNFNKSIGSINGVIMVLIVSAGLLSAVVLYNLTNVNICERRKELATIRVLGFHKNEVHRYIFRETNVLSFLGSLVGLVLGVILHAFVVKTVEIDQVMFGRDIYFLSYVLAVGISVVFTLLVDLVMRRPIDKVDMVEAMKSNE